MSEPREQPVGAGAYDERWLEAAWGASGNEASLASLAPRPRVARALKLAAIEPGMRVLDIACGRGEVPALAAEAGATAVGIDFSGASIAFAARVRSARHGRFAKGGSMQLVRADACSLPFPDGRFDRVTLLDIIEHLVPSQLDAMFREVRRLLAPGGYAVIHTLPNRWVYDVTFPLLHRVVPRLPRDPRGPIDREIHVNEQDLPGLARALEGSGLSHRLWLEQHMPAQARWNADRDRYGDNRDRIYPLLAGWAGRVLEAASATPMKLLLCNDIYGIAWAGERPRIPPRLPLALTERITLRLA